jgi:hypothetical protein
MAPATFDPLAIYATFGWLPRGFSVTNPATPQTAIQSVANVNGPNGQSVALTVHAAHQCSLTGPLWSPALGTFQFTDGGKHKRYLHSKRYARGLLCQQPGTQSFPSPVLPAGHLAGGHPAYLMLDETGHPTALAWQYAWDGWAVAQWSGPRPARITKIAADVRYRSNLRLPFPFRLTGIPASWKVGAVGNQVTQGRLTGYALYLGPGQDPAGMTVLVQPSYPNACVNIGGTTQSVSFDGAAGVLRNSTESVSTTLTGPDHTEHLQDACFANLHGMFVYVNVTRPDGIGGALGLLRHVKVLGPDLANWTTQPLG